VPDRNGHQLSLVALPEFDAAFDRELVEWFALRKGVWSGTAAELLAALRSRPAAGSVAWSQTARTLYAHLESHRHILRSLGVEVGLHHGPPRMLSVRACPVEVSAKKPPASESAVHIPSSPVNAIQPADDAQATPAFVEEPKSAASESSAQDIAIIRPDSAARFVSGRYAEKESPGGRVFENTGAALSAVAEMRDLIRERKLDPEAAIELTATRAQEIIHCCGTMVGVLQHNTVLYPVRTGIGATMAGLDLHANFFQSCVRTGGALQLRDAQRHPLLGPVCQMEGVGSLIIVPIFHHREVVGAMEFLYKEMRSFSTGQVMDLELIAGVVSESLNRAAEGESKKEEERDSSVLTPVDDNPQPQISGATDSAILGSLSSRLAAAPTRMGRALKSVWMQTTQTGPAAQEQVTTSAPPEAPEDRTEPASAEPKSAAPSTEPKA
jgi:hypothetical protein